MVNVGRCIANIILNEKWRNVETIFYCLKVHDCYTIDNHLLVTSCLAIQVIQAPFNCKL